MSIIDIDVFKKNRNGTLRYRPKSNNEYFVIIINHDFILYFFNKLLIYRVLAVYSVSNMCLNIHYNNANRSTLVYKYANIAEYRDYQKPDPVLSLMVMIFNNSIRYFFRNTKQNYPPTKYLHGFKIHHLKNVCRSITIGSSSFINSLRLWSIHVFILTNQVLLFNLM